MSFFEQILSKSEVLYSAEELHSEMLERAIQMMESG